MGQGASLSNLLSLFLGHEISQDLQDLGETFTPNKLNKYSIFKFINLQVSNNYTWKVDAATFIMPSVWFRMLPLPVSEVKALDPQTLHKDLSFCDGFSQAFVKHPAMQDIVFWRSSTENFRHSKGGSLKTPPPKKGTANQANPSSIANSFYLLGSPWHPNAAVVAHPHVSCPDHLHVSVSRMPPWSFVWGVADGFS